MTEEGGEFEMYGPIIVLAIAVLVLSLCCGLAGGIK